MQGGPLMHVVAAKAIAFGEALRKDFRAYAAQTVANARTVAYELQRRGFRLVSGGTDNHLLLVDVASRGLTGKIAEKALGAAGITVNRNGIPFDPRKPFDPSGLRIGTPALTTRGMGKGEMERIAAWIEAGVDAARREDEATIARIADEVRELALSFPIPGVAV